jgi:hypothetical protein
MFVVVQLLLGGNCFLLLHDGFVLALVVCNCYLVVRDLLFEFAGE